MMVSLKTWLPPFHGLVDHHGTHSQNARGAYPSYPFPTPTGWWLTNAPLKNHGVKVSWDDDIPIYVYIIYIQIKIPVPNHQPAKYGGHLPTLGNSRNSPGR